MKSVSTVSDFSWQQTFKKVPLVELLYSIKEEYVQLSLKTINNLILGVPEW